MTEKEKKYDLLFRQIQSLVEGEHDEIACMANMAAAIQEAFHFWWTGFYRVVGEDLVLGPFQGPIACTRIARGRGVCGTSWQEQRTVVVPDVHQFKGHIACSSASKSEIVVPIFRNGIVTAVLDVDSEKPNTFDDVDRQGLERIVQCLYS